MDDGGIEEVATPLRGTGGGNLRRTVSRWVDAAEVPDSESSLSVEEETVERQLTGSSSLDSSGRGSGSTSLARRRMLSKRPRRVDSLVEEAMSVRGAHHHGQKDLSLLSTLAMAFQTLGVVYGDLGTSPLYVFNDVFSKVPIKSDVEVLGALSLVIYTITLIPFAKYVFVVLRANDNGEGGTFALYSLICRYAKVSLLPTQQHADEGISSYKLKLPTRELSRALSVKGALENRTVFKNILLFLVLMGTSMVIGDGILTPSMSVMSAVSGLEGQVPGIDDNAVVIISIVVLLLLFSIQRFGTGKVGFIFAPVLALWFINLALVGIYNIIKHDASVLRAFNPVYIYFFFQSNGWKAWSALGGCVLCITGAEAMFADLGHFSVQSIQIAFTFTVYPCLILAYLGQGAYLLKYPQDTDNIFYDSVPEVLFWPVIVVATLAAMIASQAMISATFSVIKQSMALGCFPRIKIIHTSKRFMGQIYIPIMNYFLMVMCVLIVATFRSTNDIANAYGIAEVGVMIVSTTLVTLVMLLIWQTNIFLVILFLTLFGSIEFAYLTAVLSKIAEGGWLPLAFSSLFLFIMYTWNYGSVLKYQSEICDKISPDLIRELGPSLGTTRVSGIGLVYNELVQGVPSIFGHLLLQLPAAHSTIIFVCIKHVPVPKVPVEERFLFRRVASRDYHMFRSVARYGYKDVKKEPRVEFEDHLFESLEKFLRREAQELALESPRVAPSVLQSSDSFSVTTLVTDDMRRPLLSDQRLPGVTIEREAGAGDGGAGPSAFDQEMQREIEFLREGRKLGFTYMLAHGQVRARKESFFAKKLVVNYVYSFLRKNCRAGMGMMTVPHENVIRVGMTYMV